MAMPDPDFFDCVIVGAGPAGLTLGISLLHRGKKKVHPKSHQNLELLTHTPTRHYTNTAALTRYLLPYLPPLTSPPLASPLLPSAPLPPPYP